MKKSMLQRIGVVLLAGAFLVSGCTTKQPPADETVKEEPPKEEAPQQEEEEPEQEEQEEPGKEIEGTPEETEEPKEEEQPDLEAKLREAKIRHLYAGVLSQIVFAGQLPGGNFVDFTYGDMEANQFAIQDVDGDGREELLVFYTETDMAGMVAYVYDWDEEANQLREELLEFPALTFYENGIVIAEWSHNQGLGQTLWPFTLYQYDSESDTYQMTGSVDSWEKSYRDADYEGNPFPDDLDSDGDGILYYISEAGEYNMEAPVNQAEYDAWLKGFCGDAKPLELNVQAWEADSFSDYTPEYLKLLRDQAKASGNFPEGDLGIFYMENGMDMWELEEKIAAEHGISMEEDEYGLCITGTAEGNVICEFYMEDGGTFEYKAEKEGLALCGLVPGMPLEEAVARLKELGFYMSWENAYITGDGMGNYEVILDAANGIVNGFTFRDYCAYVS